MTPHIIQVERWHDTGMAFLRVRDGDAPEGIKRCTDAELPQTRSMLWLTSRLMCRC
jgi:hypothetical protein